MTTKKTYFFNEDDAISVEQIVSWSKAPSLDKSVYFPLVLGVHLRRLRASDVASKMEEWFAEATIDTLSDYIKIELEQLLRPDYLDNYAEAKAGGWFPIDPRREAQYRIQSTLVGLDLKMAFAAMARIAAMAPVSDLNEANRDRIQELRQKASDIGESSEKQIQNDFQRIEEAAFWLEKEMRGWEFDSAQLIPNVRYALKWVKKRRRHLAVVEQPTLPSAPEATAPILTMRQIALFTFYNGSNPIEDDSRGITLAAKYGYISRTSGRKLSVHYRTVAAPNGTTGYEGRAASSMIKDIEAVLPLLEKLASKRAQADLATLNSKFEK